MVATIIFSNSADAAKVDIYRDAILNKTFTIKYEIANPPVFETNKNAVFFDGKLQSAQTSLVLKQYSGMITANGDVKYSENYVSQQLNNIGRDGKIHYVGVCQLIKSDEVFDFYYEIENGTKKYFGTQGMFGKTHSVKANEGKGRTPYQIMLDEYNLGSPILTKAFLPIMPPEKIVDTPKTPKYKFVGSGNLEGSLSFEDFASDRNNIFSAVRYYFEGDKLVKIAQASYLKNGNEVSAYEKSVVNITEFSTTPEQSYLSLPAELKDKTKRSKEGKK